MKKRPVLIILTFLFISFVSAQTRARWMQQSTISPNGKWIAFEYKGNLSKVPAEGGYAIALTINNAYNGYPVWSHDGKKIAFASDRYGNFDVYIMQNDGTG